MGWNRVAQSVCACALLAGVAIFGAGLGADAADHLDPPMRADPNVDKTPDRGGDLADVYAFFDEANMVFAVTFGGPQATSLPAVYDRDILYTLHISNDGDPATTEIPIKIRFGKDGQFTGVQVSGLPGGAVVTGPVEADIRSGGIIVRAGLFDDPFFFDAQGLRESRQAGRLLFDKNRDFFSKQNITAVVLQIPRPLIQNGNRIVNVWAETARFGGQL